MIRFEHFSLYVDDRPILRDLSFTIVEPGLTAIVGASGCGKSTLLKVLNRLVDPTHRLVDRRNRGWSFEGTATFKGVPLIDWDADALRRKIGHVLQKPLVFERTVGDNLVRVLRHLNPEIDRSEASLKARDCLRLVALDGELDDGRNPLDRPATTLSGGQEQRLCMARALIVEPQVLCLDEPTSALDPIATAAVEDTMRHIAHDRPVIVVTHDITQARRCDRVLFLSQEKAGDGALLIADGSPEAVFDSLSERAVFEFAHVREREAWTQPAL